MENKYTHKEETNKEKGMRFEDFQKDQNNCELFPGQKNSNGETTVSNEIDLENSNDVHETHIRNTISGVNQVEEDYDGVNEDETYDGQNADDRYSAFSKE